MKMVTCILFSYKMRLLEQNSHFTVSSPENEGNHIIFRQNGSSSYSAIDKLGGYILQSPQYV